MRISVRASPGDFLASLQLQDLGIPGRAPKFGLGWRTRRRHRSRKELLHNLVFDKDDVSWGPNSTFRFPKLGGAGPSGAPVPQDYRKPISSLVTKLPAST